MRLCKRVVDDILRNDSEESTNFSESQTENDDKSSEDNLSDEPNVVMYKIKESERLYFDDSFPIKNVKEDLIDKIFKLVEVSSDDLKVNKRKFYSKSKKMFNNYRKSGGDFPENRREGLGLEEAEDEPKKSQKSTF